MKKIELTSKSIRFTRIVSAIPIIVFFIMGLGVLISGEIFIGLSAMLGIIIFYFIAYGGYPYVYIQGDSLYVSKYHFLKQQIPLSEIKVLISKRNSFLIELQNGRKIPIYDVYFSGGPFKQNMKARRENLLRKISSQNGVLL